MEGTGEARLKRLRSDHPAESELPPAAAAAAVAAAAAAAANAGCSGGRRSAVAEDAFWKMDVWLSKRWKAFVLPVLGAARWPGGFSVITATHLASACPPKGDGSEALAAWAMLPPPPGAGTVAAAPAAAPAPTGVDATAAGAGAAGAASAAAAGAGMTICPAGTGLPSTRGANGEGMAAVSARGPALAAGGGLEERLGTK